MLYEHIRVIRFNDLYKEINRKMELGYDMERPTSRNIDDLKRRSTLVVKRVLEQLGRSKVIGHGTDTIFVSGPHPKPESDYEYTITTYPVGLFSDPHCYALWSGDSLLMKGCIDVRRDVAQACKTLFRNRVTEILGIGKGDYELESALVTDFYFHDKHRGDLILIAKGKKSTNLSLPVCHDAYRKYVEDRISRLLQ